MYPKIHFFEKISSNQVALRIVLTKFLSIVDKNFVKSIKHVHDSKKRSTFFPWNQRLVKEVTNELVSQKIFVRDRVLLYFSTAKLFPLLLLYLISRKNFYDSIICFHGKLVIQKYLQSWVDLTKISFYILKSKTFI